MTKCRGQAYYGAGNMAGKVKGAAARICSRYPQAQYFHCQAHKLNLCIVNTCKLSVVTNMMNTVRVVQEFFNYPKRGDFLQSRITSMMEDSPARTKLIDCCRTRWVQRIDSLEIFTNLFPCILDALTKIGNNEGGNWNNDSVADASCYMFSLQRFQFVVTLVIVKNILSYCMNLTLRLQSSTADIAQAFKHVTTMKTTIADLRANIDDYHHKWYIEVVESTGKCDIMPSRPRTVRGQLY